LGYGCAESLIAEMIGIIKQVVDGMISPLCSVDVKKTKSLTGGMDMPATIRIFSVSVIDPARVPAS